MKVRDFYFNFREDLMNHLSSKSRKMQVNGFGVAVPLAQRFPTGIQALPISLEQFRTNLFNLPAFDILMSAAGKTIINPLEDVSSRVATPYIVPLVPDYVTRINVAIAHRDPSEQKSWFNWATDILTYTDEEVDYATRISYLPNYKFSPSSLKLGIDRPVTTFSNEFLDCEWSDEWWKVVLTYDNGLSVRQLTWPSDDQGKESVVHECLEDTLKNYRISQPMLISYSNVAHPLLVTKSFADSHFGGDVIAEYRWNEGSLQYQLPVSSAMPISTYSLAAIESHFV